MPIDSGITVALWVKFNQLQDSYFFVMGNIYFKTQGASMNWFMFNNSQYPGGALGTYAVNTWYHLALSIGNMSVGAYINGALQATTAYTVSGDTVANPRIGAEYNQGINGLIDDLRIYNTALTSSQVQSIYSTQAVPSRQVLSGTPLFTQLSPSATSSAVGAFSLRAVNGTSARAVNVAPGGTFPPTAMAPTATNSSTQTLGTGQLNGSYIASSSTSAFSKGASGAFSLDTSAVWQVNSYPAGGGSLSTPTTTTIGATNYNGEWLQFQTPFPINLTGYSIITGAVTSAVLLASTTGATSSWTLVDSQPVIASGTTTTTKTGLNFAGYSYFRFVIITSTVPYPFVQNVRFFGTVPSLAQDFYADRLGNLLTAPVTGQSLANWLGGATGYVRTWYDQSGRGNHATQSTAANQPIIQRATKGPGYACLFNGANSQVLSCAADTYSLLNGIRYAVCVTERRNNSATTGGYFGLGSATQAGQGLITGYYSSEIYIDYAHRGDDLFITVPAYAGASEPLRCAVYDYGASSTKRVYINGSIAGTNSSYDLAATSGAMTIGKTFGGGQPAYYYGEIYELLVFTQSLYDIDGTSTITQIYQNQLGAYGT
jgi:hypothetical protein